MHKLFINGIDTGLSKLVAPNGTMRVNGQYLAPVTSSICLDTGIRILHYIGFTARFDCDSFRVTLDK